MNEEELAHRARNAYQRRAGLYQDLRFAADRALRILERGRQDFEQDDLLQAAAEAVMIRLAEVHTRLGHEAQDLFPEFDWRGMRDMRNILVHRYPTIDYELVWQGLQQVAELSHLLEQRMDLGPPAHLAELQNPPSSTPDQNPDPPEPEP